MKKLKNLTALVIVIVMTCGVLTSACSPPATGKTTQVAGVSEEPTLGPTADSGAKKIRIGIALTPQGRGDKSFNDMCIKGLERAVADFGIEYKDVTPQNVAENMNALNYLAEEKYDIIFAVAFNFTNDIVTAAEQYPDVNFCGIDCSYETAIPKNLQSVIFNEQEGTYLAGIVAAMMTKTGTIGFVGGMNSPLVDKFEGGFVAGVQSVNPDVKIMSACTGSDATAWADSAKAKEIALDQISKSADIIYHVANVAGMGVFEAAAEKGIFVIGQDENQNVINPGLTLASGIKSCDMAIYNIIKEYVEKGTFNGGGTYIGNTENGGVRLTSLSDLEDEELALSGEDQVKIQAMKDAIPEEVKTAVAKAEAGIIDGSIIVPNWQVNGRPSN